MKKQNKFKLKLQAILIDLLFWIYISGCISFLTNHWFEIMISSNYVVIFGIAIGLITFFMGV